MKGVGAMVCITLTAWLLGLIQDGAGAATMDVGTLSEKQCKAALDDYVHDHGSISLPKDPEAAKTLFFLHVPRTAGRTYHSCFLKLATPPSQRCEKSYDVLRLNASMPSCGLLGSHDDLSALQYLPGETAVVTQLRDPVERILSAYEFAVEVAVRGIYGKKLAKVDKSRVSTRDVWPWSLLVPWIEEDLRQRWPHNSSALPAGQFSPYDHPLIMPLRTFIEEPIVTDLLHNGATLQVLGMTNYSHWRDTDRLRSCAARSQQTQKALHKLALQRLDTFAHVGVMEDLENSILSLASLTGLKMRGPAWRAAVDAFETGPDGEVRQVKGDDEYKHAVPLGRAYTICVARARQKAAKRRASSLRDLPLLGGRALEFTKEGRRALGKDIIARIRSKNALDEVLWERGKKIFAAKLAEQQRAGMLEQLPRMPLHAKNEGGPTDSHEDDHELRHHLHI